MNGASGDALPEASPSSQSVSWSDPEQFYEVPNKTPGGSADVDGSRVAWISGLSGGLDHYAVWVHKTNEKAQLIGSVEEGAIASNVSISHPFVSWVEYKEDASGGGPWKIKVRHLRKDTTTVVAEWDGKEEPRSQPIPLPWMADHLIAWQQLLIKDGTRNFCIVTLNLDDSDTQMTDCTAALASYPHWPRVHGDVIAYKVNKGAVKGSAARIIEPRSPQHPQLSQLFDSGGDLEEWDSQTLFVEADERGVAWIAEGAFYGDPGGIFHWSPDSGVSSRFEGTGGSPPNELALVGDAIVWGEPDKKVFAVRRDLLACDDAVVRLSSDWFKDRYKELRGFSLELFGASDSEILVSLYRSNTGSEYPIFFQTFAVFELPVLPASCKKA